MTLSLDSSSVYELLLAIQANFNTSVLAGIDCRGKFWWDLTKGSHLGRLEDARWLITPENIEELK